MARRKGSRKITKAEPVVALTVADEATVNEKLVSEAVLWIGKKVVDTLHRGLSEIGEFLFENFFDGDLERARSHNPKKNASFQALADRCESKELPISKTSLYNAVNVVVMGRMLPQGATAFRQLSPTHQAALLVLRDPAKVERLAQRAVTNDLSVRALKAIVIEEVARRERHEPARGRPSLPIVLKALRHAIRQLTPEGGRSSFSKAHIDGLTDIQLKDSLKLAQSLSSSLEKLTERLKER